MSCKSFIKLNNGHEMPALGIGTWRAADEEVENAINLALEIGYRHIDAAPVYMNEKAVGRVLKKWLDSGKVKREELYVVTKLPKHENRPESVEKQLRQSLADLQLSYVDMYLIHTPFTIPSENQDFSLKDADGNLVIETTTDHIAVWKKLEEMVELGLTKSIGLSNFNKKQVQRIIDNSKIKPSNLQIELHIYLQQHDLVNFCKANNIVVTAYSPLGSKGIEVFHKMAGNENPIPNLLENDEVIKIANRLNKTPAQILLKWILQRGIATIPKSTNPERLRQNLDLFNFELSSDDMSILRGLDQDCRLCDFSFFKGLNKHPEFPW